MELERLTVPVEGDALERAVVDEAVERVLIGLRMFAVVVLRAAVVQDAAIDDRGGGVPVTAFRCVLTEPTRSDPLFVRIFAADDNVQAIIGEGLAGGELDEDGFVVAIGADAALDIAL